MAFRSLVASLYLAFLLPFVARAKAPQTSQTAHVSLTITCDADCNWNVDDDQYGTLKKGEEARVEVLFGAHRVQAKSTDGKLWEKRIEIVEPKPEQIRISFVNAVHPDVQSGEGAVQAGGISKFYAESRQILVEAKVWKQVGKSYTGDTAWIPKEAASRSPFWARRYAQFPPPARGLTASSFHVFDNASAITQNRPMVIT